MVNTSIKQTTVMPVTQIIPKFVSLEEKWKLFSCIVKKINIESWILFYSVQHFYVFIIPPLCSETPVIAFFTFVHYRINRIISCYLLSIFNKLLSKCLIIKYFCIYIITFYETIMFLVTNKSFHQAIDRTKSECQYTAYLFLNGQASHFLNKIS